MSVAVLDAEIVFPADTELGEGPVWDAREACLYFTDILKGRVHRFDPSTGNVRTYEIGQSVGTVLPTERGDLVLAVRDGFARLDPATGRVESIAAGDADRPDLRMNDGACDPAGRFWAGTMALDERRDAGALYRLGVDGRVERVLEPVTISNGIDWSDDGRTMFYVDSATRRVDAFDFDVATGALGNRRPFVTIPKGQGFPDGLTLDAHGGVWVALWGGSAVHRYSRDGALDAVVRVPAAHTTSCTFGGADLSDLFITSATIRLSDVQRAEQPLAGGVFRCRPGFTGRPPHRYRG